MDLIIRNGLVVTASDAYRADIGVVDGAITHIGAALDPGARTRVIDATGCWSDPRRIDVHTHLDTPAGPVVTCGTTI